MSCLSTWTAGFPRTGGTCDLIHFSDAGSELAATVIAEELLKVMEQGR